MADEFQHIDENNDQHFNWTSQDLIYFDSFAKNTVKLWDETEKLLYSRSDFMTYTNKNETKNYIHKIFSVTKINDNVPPENTLD